MRGGAFLPDTITRSHTRQHTKNWDQITVSFSLESMSSRRGEMPSQRLVSGHLNRLREQIAGRGGCVAFNLGRGSYCLLKKRCPRVDADKHTGNVKRPAAAAMLREIKHLYTNYLHQRAPKTNYWRLRHRRATSIKYTMAG